VRLPPFKFIDDASILNFDSSKLLESSILKETSTGFVEGTSSEAITTRKLPSENSLIARGIPTA